MKKFFALCLVVLSQFIGSMAHANPYDLITRLQLQLDQQQEEIRQLRGETEALRAMLSKGLVAAPQVQTSQAQPMTQPTTEPTKQPAEQPQPLQNFAPAPLAQVDASLLYTQAYDMLEARRFSDARLAFEDFIHKFPHNPLTMNAHFWIGEMDYLNGDYASAALKFGDAYQEYKSQKSSGYTGEALSRAPEVMMKLAMSMSNIGKHDAAKLTLSELEKEFPLLPGNISQQVSLLKRELTRKAA